MNCPNCDGPVLRHGICPNCGIDAYLYKKTLRISDILYNKGLAQAKAGDLSAAIENLNKCIYFNKENIQARNLLGLVYFEFGRVGDALKHWIISLSILKKNNIAKNYINELQNDQRAREWYASSLKNYNQALLYLQQNSEDMAIIQLRRALEQNPKFVDAMNLLALCYLMQKDKEKAAATVEKVLSIDVNNSTALGYFKEIYPNKNKIDVVRKQNAQAQTGRYRSGPAPKHKKNFSDSFHIAEIVSFILGGLCVFGLFYILVVPGIREEHEAEITRLNAAVQQQDAVETVEINTVDEEAVADLERKVGELEQRLLARDEHIERLNRINDVYSASDLQRRNELEAAADILFHMSPSGLPVNIAELYDNLSSDVIPRVVKNLYDEGVARFNQEEYKEAAVSLGKAYLYSEENGAGADAIIYYLGFTMEMMEEYDSAVAYYEELLETYPNSNFINAATSNLEEILGEE